MYVFAGLQVAEGTPERLSRYLNTYRNIYIPK